MNTKEYDSMESTQYGDLRIHRHDDGTVGVQINGKTSSCGQGNVACAFLRSLAWVEDGETHGPKECLAVDATAIEAFIEGLERRAKDNERKGTVVHQGIAIGRLRTADELEELINDGE